jgi:hypothetical protein
MEPNVDFIEPARIEDGEEDRGAQGTLVGASKHPVFSPDRDVRM